MRLCLGKFALVLALLVPQASPAQAPTPGRGDVVLEIQPDRSRPIKVTIGYANDKIIVVLSRPTDPPKPQPSPPPAPVSLPDGKFGLAAFTYDTLVDDPDLSDDEKTRLAGALSASFGGVAAKIAAVPGYNDLAVIMDDARKANEAAIKQSGVPVASTAYLKQQLGDRLYSLYRDKSRIRTAAELADAFREIKAGLDAIAK